LTSSYLIINIKRRFETIAAFFINYLGEFMQTTSSKVTSKGQIVIPKKIRDKYGISPSTSIHWVEKAEGILMIPDSEDPIVAARGMLKGSGILKAYLKDKKREKKKEDKKGRDR
jgi:AbrB family looped-hinge helix DNA binding protein